MEQYYSNARFTKFTREDTRQIEEKGTTVSQVEKQIALFKGGVSYLRLKRACVVNDGIVQVPDSEHQTLIDLIETERKAGRIDKFVPASGAATRLFAVLYSALEKLEVGQPVEDAAFAKFANGLEQFAFFGELSKRLTRKGVSLAELKKNGNYVPVLRELLDKDCMNYAGLPKSLLLFHSYSNGSRTAVEEQFCRKLCRQRLTTK